MYRASCVSCGLAKSLIAGSDTPQKKGPNGGPSTNSLGVDDPSHPALGLAETEDKNLCRVGEQR